MADLTGRGAYGQKEPKPAKKPRKGLRKQSKKREAYLESPARAAGLAHMSEVAQLPCLVCGSWPVEVHHFPHPRSDMRTGPLCPFHHRKEYGPQAYHYSRPAFNDLHGSDEALLDRVAQMIADKKRPG